VGAFGAKPQRTRPSVEALLRRVDGGLPRIDRITDAYNAASIACLLPVGGEDLARYEGPARLVRAAGDEAFDTSADGQPVVERPEPGEVVWRDDRGGTCRRGRRGGGGRGAGGGAPGSPPRPRRRCSSSTDSPRSAPRGCAPPRRS